MPQPIAPHSEITIRQLLSQGQTQLDADTARLDCQLLLANLLGKDRSWVIAHDDEPVPTSIHDVFLQQVALREEGRPIAYLLGKQEFWNLDLAVNSSTLIPRPDTELLIDSVLELHPAEPISIIDLGTGSGAIALALAAEHPSDTIFAMDYSKPAAFLAKQNSERNQISNVHFFVGQWSSAVADHSIDMIVSNPPYIAEEDPHLADLQFEPATALVAGHDGLDDIRRILNDAKRLLKPKGIIAIEHGYDQQPEVMALFEQQGLVNVRGKCDLGENPRIVLAEAPPTP